MLFSLTSREIQEIAIMKGTSDDVKDYKPPYQNINVLDNIQNKLKTLPKTC